MKYIKLFWVHNDASDPIIVYYEVDDQRWNTRIVEIFSEGSTRYASEKEECGGCFISPKPVPTVDKLADKNNGLFAFDISSQEFERVWDIVTRRPRE